MKTALITGCGSGFGARLAALWLDRGHRVIATDPDPQRLEALRKRGAVVHALDVRDTGQIRTVVDDSIAQGGFDILVNNGGYAIFGTIEEVPMHAVEELFDVNVFGVGRMTRAALPHLRERGGSIVQLSSVAGRAVFPESGWYAATKYAVEAMTEALVQELAATSVRIRLVEPGSFNTQFLSTARALSPEHDPQSVYAPVRPLWEQRKLSVLEPPQDPERVALAIDESLERNVAFERVVVGEDAVRILAVRDALGADGFSNLSAERNGARPLRTPVPPSEVEDALRKGGPGVQALRTAFAFGHLDHWRGDPDGDRALDALASHDAARV